LFKHSPTNKAFFEWQCREPAGDHAGPSYRNPVADSIIRSWDRIYLPAICVVSLFVALAWLGLASDRNLVIVITDFAVLLVLEFILLMHVAVRRQKTAKQSQKSCCVD
jgi:hypothetical protein